MFVPLEFIVAELVLSPPRKSRVMGTLGVRVLLTLLLPVLVVSESLTPGIIWDDPPAVALVAFGKATASDEVLPPGFGGC